MQKRFFIAGIILVILIGMLISKGKSLFYLVNSKLKERETTESIQGKIEDKVQNQLQPYLQNIGLDQLPDKLIMLGLKEEQRLELYAEGDQKIQLLKTYPFTAMSGTLGPKLREGDKQIPEGIYHIEYLNPNSSYYLSLKVDYPNAFDREKARLDQRTQLGGDIFIHGKEVTIGCIPIGDEAIEEVFILGAHAYKNPIKVIISPRDFRKVPDFPEIEGISWEQELYQILAEELSVLPRDTKIP